MNGFKDYIKKNETILFNVEVLPEDFTEYKINPYFTNNNSNNIQLWHISGNQFQINGLEVGINTLNVEILVEEEIEVDGQIVVVDKVIKTFNKNIEVLNPPTTFNLFANSQKHGLEELLTIGNEEIVYEEEVVKEKYVVKNHTFNFTTNDVDLKYVEFSSSDESVAYFNKDKQLVILKEGKITITATELQSQLLGEPLISTLDLRCVLGVEVGNYKDLVKATKDDKQVVITNDIDLGEKLIDIDDNGVASIINGRTESECAQILSEEINQIETSSEWNYYKYNSDYNAKTPPLLNYIIKFTNNCYGNGYVLNANNITNFVKDISKGELFSFAKFRGPLDLVALPGASVKAQDNICFIASDNVMINNVELVGADMHGLDSNDLNELNYVGTVLEIMGDNVKVVNSRINNGRNCVRVFGKESGNEDKINVLIESCIISNAREFLVKMGTNTKMRGEFSQRDSINLANESLITNDIWEACAPKINGFRHLNDGTLTESEYNALVNEYKNSAEYQALIKTNLTIKNCVLQTSGLFSIGLESSFAGPALDGGRWNSYNFNEYGWKQIAGTSYPTQLNLEGTVKIYDWKNITHIDSSTLVEGGMFDFNLSKMIENIDNNNIISNIDGEKYVHGGVVMYGGGKNYALINLNLENIEPLKNYSLSLDSLNNSLTTILKKASGREDFRVLLYDNNSNFSYRQQVLELNSSNPYNIGKYII